VRRALEKGMPLWYSKNAEILKKEGEKCQK